MSVVRDSLIRLEIAEEPNLSLLFALIGGLTAYFNYKNSKVDGTLPKPESFRSDSLAFEQPPLGPNPTRRERLAHWLGLYEE